MLEELVGENYRLMFEYFCERLSEFLTERRRHFHCRRSSGFSCLLEFMKCIVAVDSEWGVGKDNELLVHLSGDLKYFKENTLGKILIMGRKTVESLPGGKPLAGRTTIILTKNREYVPKYRENADTYVCYSKQEVDRLIESLKADGKSKEDFIVAGGGSIYEMFITECEQFLVTRIGASFGADTYFPNLDLLEKENKVSLKWHSEKMEENGIEYIFTIYTKCN